MAAVVVGPLKWEGERDEEGNRIFKITYLIKAHENDGPATVLRCPDLPLIGSVWNFGNDLDLYAWCRPDATLTMLVEREPNIYWEVEFTFSTKPLKKCHDIELENPLLEPMLVQGGFYQQTDEATVDKDGLPIVNSAHEQIRGPVNEWPSTFPVVRIYQNVPLLQADLIYSMRDTVNNLPLWGLPARTILLTGIDWSKKFHGQCYYYYERIFEFRIDYRGWDREVLDEGTKVLNGQWNTTTGDWDLKDINGAAPDRDNPAHFIRAVDRLGNPIHVILDGFGKPAVPSSTQTVGAQTVFGEVQNDDVLFTGKFVNPSNAQGLHDGDYTTVLSNADAMVRDTLFFMNFPINRTTSNIVSVLINFYFQHITDLGSDIGDVKIYYRLGAQANWVELDDFEGTISFMVNPASYDITNGVNGKWDALREIEAKVVVQYDHLHNLELRVDAVEVVVQGEGVRAGTNFISKYKEANFLLLGIPTIL